MIFEDIANFILKFIVNLLITGASFVFILSLAYEQFPPPIGRIQAQIRESQALNRQSLEAKNNKTKNDSVLEALADNDKISGPKRDETVRIATNSTPSDILAELRVIRFKLQNLEARQHELKRTMDFMKPSRKASAKPQKTEK